jgi:hypothetical protein
MVIARPWQRVAPVVVEVTEDDVTGVPSSVNDSIGWGW